MFVNYSNKNYLSKIIIWIIIKWKMFDNYLNFTIIRINMIYNYSNNYENVIWVKNYINNSLYSAPQESDRKDLSVAAPLPYTQLYRLEVSWLRSPRGIVDICLYITVTVVTATILLFVFLLIFTL